ncbi:MAG TPA: hypothetical protein VLC97_14125 [Rhodanobacteraceae bacterium]|nr:hypothetical protein [Rhodanobacteraceae bacterium]
MGFFTMKSHAAVFAWAMAALALSCDAAAGDFIFGEDFEGVPSCTGGIGFSIGATPPARTGSLGTQHRYLVKLHACNVSGTATLGQSGAPDSWTRTLDPGSLTLADGAVGVALLTVTVPTNADAGLGTFNLSATHNAELSSTDVTLDIANEWILHFAPNGTGSIGSAHNFPGSLIIKVGAKIRLISDDTTDTHLIHADGGTGLIHQNVAGPGLSAGQEYDLTPTAPNTPLAGHLYCHYHGGPVTVVTVVP